MKANKAYDELSLLDDSIPGCYNTIGMATMHLAFMDDDKEVSDDIVTNMIDRCIKYFDLQYSTSGHLSIYQDSKLIASFDKSQLSGNSIEDFREYCRVSMLCLQLAK